jgi:catechol 2,3-dioxygenase-like lactoylglutathione lyase family enzyme
MKFNKLIPEIGVKDISKSLHFYVVVLGFKLEYEREESKFAFLSYNGSQMMIEELNGEWDTGKLEHPFGRGINLQIEADNIEPLLASLKKHNYSLFREPKESWYRKDKCLFGAKEFLVMDPDGYLLRFSQDIGKKKLK